MLAIAFVVSLTSCSTLGYYSQSVIGHSRLMLARQSIDKVLLEADADLKSKLLLAQDLKQFAVNRLALPDNQSYSSYVALEREFPVWTVVAAEEFSIQARSWCYPVIGCASYRGYFSKHAALEYAESLAKDNFETTVGGAVAYSTLGWFSDPLVPSMMRYGVADFAETMFHELAHQQLYIKNNSDFNEAFATMVGEQGTIIWLSENRPELLADYRQQLAARAEFSALIASTKQSLADVYSAEKSAGVMRKQKLEVFDRLNPEYQKLKQQSWQGKGWFDNWFKKPLNNARLAAFSTYRDQVPNFTSLLQQCGSNFTRFYNSLATAKTDQEHATVPPSCVADI